MPIYMTAPALRYLLSALIALGALPALAQGTPDAGPGRAPCDALHPAHFTRIEERQPTYFERAEEGSAVVLFEPELPVQDGGTLLTAWCNELEGRLPPANTIGIHPGRFNVSERSELVFTFNPAVVDQYVGHLGRLDVEGQIVTGNNTARAIEIPGYREIGKPVVSGADQGLRNETVIASIAQVLQAAEELADSNTLARIEIENTVRSVIDAGTAVDGGVTTANAGAAADARAAADAGILDGTPPPKEDARKIMADVLGTSPDGGVSTQELGERWLMTHLFHSPQEYAAIFENILAHSSPIALTSAEHGNGQDTFQRVLTVARLGQRVLEQQEVSLERMRNRLARKEGELDREIIGWYARGLEVRALAPTSPAPTWDPASQPALVCNPAMRFEPQNNPFCSDSFLLETCSELVRLTETLCRPVDAVARRGLIDSVQKLIREMPTKIEPRTAVRTQALRNVSSAELHDLMLAHAERFALYSPEKNTQGLAQDLWRKRLVEQLSGFQAVVYEEALIKELAALHSSMRADKTRQEVLGKLRTQLRRHAASGWREVRLQPKVIGAKAGDVIELKISYIPSSGVPITEAGVNAQSAAGTGATAGAGLVSPTPNDGTQRAAVWTLRFLVDRNGVYITAGPRLSLVSTLDHKPDAATFQGARGKLTLGVGIDIMYMPGKGASFTQRFLGFMIPGAGLRLDNLDFDTSQSVEFGLEGHVLLLRGVFSFGVGYAVTSPRTPVSRGTYFSLGLGVEQAFDMARDLANEFSR